MTIPEKLKSLREQMKTAKVDAYIIPLSDPHISEYLPDHFKALQWLSGFTGSAGTLVITQDFAGLWTDSRYFVQAREQLDQTGFQLVPLKTQGAPEFAQWVAENLQPGQKVAFDGKLASEILAESIQKFTSPKEIIVDGKKDLLNAIWTNRPLLPSQPAFLLKTEQVGQSRLEKIEAIRSEMRASGTDTHLISSLDDLAWAFNIRGRDVHCNPVVLGFAKITLDSCTLYIDAEKLTPIELEELHNDHIQLRPYNEIWTAASSLPSNSRILIDTKRTCHALYSALPKEVFIFDKINPSTQLKAVKNATEIESTRDAMIQDGIALTRFFMWLEDEITTGREQLSEIAIAEKLTGFRSAQPGYIGDSFDTISGYKDHGALPHYKATEQSNSVLKDEGLLLIDSGGQYLTGTTDITRVISLGNIVEEEKIDYTLVLKGTIEGSTAVFPKGTRGYQIDAITRKPLWDNLRNYGHGTGHGVGFFLNVHEGPHVFNAGAIDVPIESGMITSIEPGLYREGQYGIRIENLVLAQENIKNNFGEFLSFETLTLCYIETSLINKDLLDKKHIDWINSYHAMVFQRLSAHLNETEKSWLKVKTSAI